MSRRKYLEPCDKPVNADDFDCKGRIRCPIWQCSGHLYLKFEKHFDGPEREDGWQIPSIKCDDCGTVFRNELLDK